MALSVPIHRRPEPQATISTPPPARIGAVLGYAALLVFVSLIEFRMFAGLHQIDLYDLSKAAEEVTTGTPHWRAFQNRLLGPFAIHAVAELTGKPFSLFHNLAILCLIVVMNLTAFALVWKLTNRLDVACRYAIGFALAFFALQPISWVFVWDFIDMPLFLLFAYGAFAGKSAVFFVPVFLVSMLNREVGLFVAFWLMLDSLGAAQRRRFVPKIVDGRKLLLGAGLAIAGLVYTKVVRDALFVASSLPASHDSMDNEMPIVGNHFNLRDNVLMVVDNFVRPTVFLEVTICIAWCVFIAYLVRNRRAIAERHLKVVAVMIAMLASVPVFGFINETRHYFVMLPFVMFLVLYLNGHPKSLLKNQA